MANGAEVIRAARELNPQVAGAGARRRTCATCRRLKAAGADTVYSGEGEVALAFIEDILDRLGATPEQIDRERARLRTELSAQS